MPSMGINVTGEQTVGYVIPTRWLNIVRAAISFLASYFEKNKTEYSASIGLAGLGIRQEYKDIRKSSWRSWNQAL